MAAKLVLEWMWQTGGEKDGEVPWQAKQDVRVHEPRRRREGGRESGGVHEYDSNLISLDVWWRGVWGERRGGGDEGCESPAPNQSV